ncbi:lipopolysaccharide assembly protein LapA domain-containing protein [Pelagibius sp.]|uniref:lipopolysaccharide assembly protein LapA domain-containing protein n=1 Tax=Pelagibius sp. TaxID=1931238 RepID=UPI003B5123B4
MRYIFWFMTLLLTPVFIVFTVANRDPVVIDFWPFEIQQALPFSLVVLACLLFGFVVGAFLMWLRFGAARARARQAQQRAAVLERELTNLKRSAAAHSPASAAGLPSAPPASTAADQTPRLPAAAGSP